jgi:hypothetical protein
VTYEQNLRALLDAIKILESQNPAVQFRLTCRCEHIRAHVVNGATEVTVLPFATEGQVKRDMESADLLYLPLPFGEAHEKFARYSLSTKMVTYAGSGVPILYHGPETSAAYDILRQYHAAIFLVSLRPEEIAESLDQLTDQTRIEVASNALELARRDFMLVDQTRRFWGAFAKMAHPA